MAIITNPTIKNLNDRNYQLGSLPLRSDITTATKYIQENSLGSYSSFTSDSDNRFSDDGGHAYNYYVSGVTYIDYWQNSGITSEWRTEFGYGSTIETITYT